MSPIQLGLDICNSSNSRRLLQFLYSLRNPYRNLKSENSQDYAQKPQRNCTFMNSASVALTEVLYIKHGYGIYPLTNVQTKKEI